MLLAVTLARDTLLVLAARMATAERSAAVERTVTAGAVPGGEAHGGKQSTPWVLGRWPNRARAILSCKLQSTVIGMHWRRREGG